MQKWVSCINQNVIECNQFLLQATLKSGRTGKHQQPEVKNAIGVFHEKPAIMANKTKVDRLTFIHKYDLYC